MSEIQELTAVLTALVEDTRELKAMLNKRLPFAPTATMPDEFARDLLTAPLVDPNQASHPLLVAVRDYLMSAEGRAVTAGFARTRPPLGYLAHVDRERQVVHVADDVLLQLYAKLNPVKGVTDPQTQRDMAIQPLRDQVVPRWEAQGILVAGATYSEFVRVPSHGFSLMALAKANV